MKQFLEFIPLLAFLLGFVFGKSIYVATAVFLVALLLTLVLQWLMRVAVSKAQWVTLGLGLLFGGATLAFHNDLFIRLKPTVIYWLFALVLAISARWFGKNLIEAMLSAHASAPSTLWRTSNRMWVGFFTVMGVLNLWIAFRLELQTWVYFKTIGAIVLMLLMTIWQMAVLFRYMKEAPAAAAPTTTEQPSASTNPGAPS